MWFAVLVFHVLGCTSVLIHPAAASVWWSVVRCPQSGAVFHGPLSTSLSCSVLENKLKICSLFCWPHREARKQLYAIYYLCCCNKKALFLLPPHLIPLLFSVKKYENFPCFWHPRKTRLGSEYSSKYSKVWFTFCINTVVQNLILSLQKWAGNPIRFFSSLRNSSVLVQFETGSQDLYPFSFYQDVLAHPSFLAGIDRYMLWVLACWNKENHF